MVDCANGNEIFRDRAKDERITIQTELIESIKMSGGFGVAAIAMPHRMSPKSLDADEYTLCLQTCIIWIISQIYATSGDANSKVAFFLENGHANSGKANEIIKKMMQPGNGAPASQRIYGSHAFAGKLEIPLLQAADILAWQCRKYIGDLSSAARKPRKDMLSLTEKNHEVLYLSFEGGEAAMVRCDPVAVSGGPAERYIRALLSSGAEADRVVRSIHSKGLRLPVDGDSKA